MTPMATDIARAATILTTTRAIGVRPTRCVGRECITGIRLTILPGVIPLAVAVRPAKGAATIAAAGIIVVAGKTAPARLDAGGRGGLHPCGLHRLK